MLAEAAPPPPPGTGAGVARVLATALERAGLAAASTIAGQLWISDRWQAEIIISDQRRAEEAPFALGHHLLARLAEFAARACGGELGTPVLTSFEDLATAAPAALLHYLAGYAQGGAERQQLWRRGFELDPKLVALRTGVAAELLAEGRSEAAAALLAGTAVADGFAAAELGIGLWAAGETTVSQQLLQAAVRTNPENGLVLAALAALLAEHAAGSDEASHAAWDEALLLASQATQLAGEDFRTWAALAAVHRAGGDFEQAGFYYGFALRLAPDAPSVLKDASACWLAAHKPRQALPLIERARQVAPADAENAGNLAFAHRLLGERGAALQAARTAARLAPGDARLHVLHGEVALEAGEREEALEAWARAAELEPALTINPEGGNLGLEAG